MKNLILLFVIIILFCACSKAVEDNIKIVTKVNGFNDTIYVVTVYGYQDYYALVHDNITWYDQGIYKLKLQAEQVRDSLINKLNEIKKKEYKPL